MLICAETKKRLPVLKRPIDVGALTAKQQTLSKSLG